MDTHSLDLIERKYKTAQGEAPEPGDSLNGTTVLVSRQPDGEA